MKNIVHCSSFLGLCLMTTVACAAMDQYPNKAAFLAAIHGDLLGIQGFASGALTARPALTYAGNGRSFMIDSNVSGPTRLMSWGTGIGAPNPVNITSVFTQGRPTTAFGCYLRVANNLNQSVGGVVLLSTNTEQMQVTVPAAGMFVAFTTTVPFGRVDINAQSGALVEMIDDVNIADRAGLVASDHAVDAGIAILGINPLDSRFSTDDQSSFLSTGGANFGNSRDVWWTYTPGTSGVLSANTYGSGFDTLLGVYNGSAGAPTTGTLPLAMNDDASGTLQSALALHVNAGTTYYIRAGGYAGGTGTGRVTLTLTPECEADFNHDGAIDFFDYLDFVDAFSIGC